MIIKTKIAICALGLLLSQFIPAWGQDLQNQHEALTRQYELNLQRIPETLSPEQKFTLEQQFKERLMYERWRLQASQPPKPTPPKETTQKP
jgi:hypothetical protein